MVSFDENNKHATDVWRDLYLVLERLPGRKGVLTRSFPGSFQSARERRWKCSGPRRDGKGFGLDETRAPT